MSKTDFQDGGRGGHLGFPINTTLVNFDPEVSRPVATKQISAHFNQRFGNSCRKWIFKMAAVVAILEFRSTQFQLS